jgi:hypothetical protein
VRRVEGSFDETERDLTLATSSFTHQALLERINISGECGHPTGQNSGYRLTRESRRILPKSGLQMGYPGRVRGWTREMTTATL